MTGAPSLLAVPFRAFLLACRNLGVDDAEVRAGAGVSEAVLDDPNGRVTLEQGQLLWALAYQASGDPLLGLHAAQALPAGAYRVFDHLIANSPTVAEAYHRVSRYQRLLDNAARLDIEEHETQVVLRMRHEHFPTGLPRPYVEYSFGVVALRAPELWGFELEADRMDFSYPAPPDEELSELQDVFRCSLNFEADQDAIIVPRSFYDRPTERAEPALFEALVSHAERLTEAVPAADDLLTRTRQVVASELAGGDPGLASVADKLGLGGRTLQRRLGERGVKFGDLVDEMRRTRALDYVRAGVSASEVSHLLGYSQDTAFFRAFKRWTGQTPSEFLDATER